MINAVYNPGLDTRPYAQWLTTALQQGQFTDADQARAKAVCEQLDWTMFQSSGVTDLQRYAGPVLLIMGEADPVCTRRQQQAIAAGGGAIRWLPGGHQPFIECPEPFGEHRACVGHRPCQDAEDRLKCRGRRRAAALLRCVTIFEANRGDSGASVHQGQIANGQDKHPRRRTTSAYNN